MKAGTNVTTTDEQQTPPPFDPQVVAALPMVADGSNPDFGKYVIDLFVDSAGKAIAEFASAMTQHDGPTMQRVAHSLKSSAATVGALALAAKAREIEMALRAQALPVATWPDELSNHYDRFRQALVHDTATTSAHSRHETEIDSPPPNR